MDVKTKPFKDMGNYRSGCFLTGERAIDGRNCSVRNKITAFSTSTLDDLSINALKEKTQCLGDENIWWHIYLVKNKII